MALYIRSEARYSLVSVHWLWGHKKGFQSGNENFFARSRKTRADAEAYCCTPHKKARGLTQRLRKKAIYGWKLAIQRHRRHTNEN